MPVSLLTVSDNYGVWLEKVLQLYQAQTIHNSIMMIGPSGSALKVLLQALECVEGCKSVFYVIDPKVVSKDALYINLDQKTNEWKDGLFAHILRNIIKNIHSENFKSHWITHYELKIFTSEMIYYNYLKNLISIPLYDDKERSSIHRVENSEETISLYLIIQCAISNILSKHMIENGLVTKTLVQAEKLIHIMDFTYMRMLNTLFSLLNKTVCNVIEYHLQHPDFPMIAEHL
ncbi:23430_t:CDS:2, partial [Gigaspora margarita]